MAERAGISSKTATQSAVPPLITVDRHIARALSEQIAEQYRLSFAQSFTFLVVQSCLETSAIPQTVAAPVAIELVALAAEASNVARKFGKALASLEPREAVHLIGVIYFSALPDTYRAIHGIYYTPPRLVDRLISMAEDAAIDWGKARVLDPACGGGAFMVPIAQRMAASLKGANPKFILQQISTRLHGFELDPFGAWLAQTAIELGLQDIIRATKRPAPQLVKTRDSLDIQPADIGFFDLVIGNPPYGRVTPVPERRAFFDRSLYGHANLYGLFTDAALHWVKKGGVVGYVTPTSMLSGLYYKSLRRLLAKIAPPLAVNFIGERNGVFADVLQETILATYRKDGPAHVGKVGFISLDAQGNTSFCKTAAFTLPVQPEAPWLLPRGPNQVKLTRRLSSMPHRLSDYGYEVCTGPLVWNRFKDQLHSERNGNSFPVVWAESVTSNGRFIWRSKKRNHMPWFEARLPKDGWLIVTRPCVLLQRTTAKEQPRRLIAAEMPEAFIRRFKGVIVENHLNMIRTIVPEPKVPAAVIAAILSTLTVDAAFRCINGSVAVSAFELEELPLPAPSVMKKFAVLVASGASAKKQEALIAAAYGRADAAATA